MSLFKIISPKTLAEKLQKEATRRVVAVDSTWYLPHLQKDAKKEFMELERLPNAVFFDIDGVKDVNSPYPHMLPDTAKFNESMSELGIRNTDILVVYDRVGNFSAPRCAWTLAVFGHKLVYLLNNFPEYKAEGYPLDTAPRTSFSELEPSDYKSDKDFTQQEVLSYEEIHQLVEDGKLAETYNAFDARALPRFTGESSEPRPDIPSGHIPGVQPMPFTEVVKNGIFEVDPQLAAEKLQEYLKSSGCRYDATKPTVAMCGTGVSGVIIKTALENAGVKNVKLYDGSWTEWALRSEPKYIVKGRN
ncbi:LAQU0S01e05336g1_1 [Lachancea quebecensis]|uniref:Sulfurtransferase n=1 Tax=Lachancea quebecensis TaxID=1654605 RepID=A0A0P1KLV1_9SACH|nr:LAQU0S01e05336g1_1 [Lachancea quebecensis]